MEVSKDELIEIGKIVGVHGLKGDVKIYPWCDDASDILLTEEFFIDGINLDLIEKRIHKNIVLAKIKGLDALEQVRKYINKVVRVKRGDIKLEKGEFLVRDLLGLDVIDNQSKKKYGKIFDVIKTGANDVYEIENENCQKFLIPAIKDVVKAVKLDRGVMEITLIKGLFGDED
ncbi:MAG: ribosome maturation factor RimM [Oscillospiraceae bacterium]|jgi:16S rRNA processing protein RimM|nr:ribosome maturation factor RimM [Oscillospiraceae bacterium]